MSVEVTRELLAARGLAINPDQFYAAVAAIVQDMPAMRRDRASHAALTDAQTAALHRGGLDPTPKDHGAGDPYTAGQLTYASIVATALPVRETAQRLGVSDARIRQRLEERSLYGLKHGGTWRVPLFQFADDHTLIPGVDRVMRVLDPATNPVRVYRWFTMPTADLTIEGEQMSPRDWLLCGGSPDTVARIAAVL